MSLILNKHFSIIIVIIEIIIFIILDFYHAAMIEYKSHIILGNAVIKE